MSKIQTVRGRSGAANTVVLCKKVHNATEHSDSVSSSKRSMRVPQWPHASRMHSEAREEAEVRWLEADAGSPAERVPPLRCRKRFGGGWRAIEGGRADKEEGSSWKDQGVTMV